MSRIFNFSAGPATLPEAVLKQVQEELLDWRGAGMGVMEMSHRDKEFMSIASQCEADLREVMAVPANYKVLFMQGGATAQFGIVPQNLLRGKAAADYVLTGDWGKKAAKEMGKFGKANIAASAEAEKFSHIPPRAGWKLDPDAAYVHITTNETIHGVQFRELPEVGAVPLVADASSDIACRPMDVSKFGLIYAGAQKNIGPAGLTLVIVRDDLIGQTLPGTLSIHDYKAVTDNDSMLNTPSTFSWYVCGLVFQWLKKEGGLAAVGARNERKAKALYDYIDSQDFYKNPVKKEDRSIMNVPFTLTNAETNDAEFLKGAKAAGLNGLKGHRAVGGMRASIYNAMPEAGVAALIDYMKEFVRTRG
ncbi:MAG: 3-phosphoserine/phosphohydroxythreonine transaminase [Nevskiaceae bacterium]|nr:MAG: 3-phosphoserine/phosphohydroxythreonine transaminase [Nevskiaceae bacterium]TAM27476.1 MAG: 3-phosphoserine/phosphohydroxythreonine transaminase [Nevskiaceae bacterium]